MNISSVRRGFPVTGREHDSAYNETAFGCEIGWQHGEIRPIRIFTVYFFCTKYFIRR